MKKWEIQEELVKALQINFQERSTEENEIITNLFSSLFQNFTHLKCRWISLLCETVFRDSKGELAIPETDSQSIIIVPNIVNSQSFGTMKVSCEPNLSEIPFYTLLNKRTLSSAEWLSAKTIEQEIHELSSCQYFQELPRKRFFHILRNIEILQFSFNQIIYLQNEALTPQKYIYFLREGELIFLKRDRASHKKIQLFQFGEGYIFGTQDIKRRQVGVKCGSSKAIVFRMRSDFFNAFLRRSCEDRLKSNSKKLAKFMQERYTNAGISINQNSQFLTQPIFRSFSIPNFESKALKFKQQRQDKKAPLPSLANLRLPVDSRNKLLGKHDITVAIPEFQEERLILLRQLKGEKVREKVQASLYERSRAEVLLSLLKTSYQFQKTKHKKRL